MTGSGGRWAPVMIHPEDAKDTTDMKNHKKIGWGGLATFVSFVPSW